MYKVIIISNTLYNQLMQIKYLQRWTTPIPHEMQKYTICDTFMYQYKNNGTKTRKIYLLWPTTD